MTGAYRLLANVHAFWLALTPRGPMPPPCVQNTQKDLERKISEVELDRTLCMNRIAQVCT